MDHAGKLDSYGRYAREILSNLRDLNMKYGSYSNSKNLLLWSNISI